jgi:hypothetical protein
MFWVGTIRQRQVFFKTEIKGLQEKETLQKSRSIVKLKKVKLKEAYTDLFKLFTKYDDID